MHKAQNLIPSSSSYQFIILIITTYDWVWASHEKGKKWQHHHHEHHQRYVSSPSPLPMIVSYGIWASHEESDNDSEQNESEDSSQEKDQQDLKLAHVIFLFSISKKRSAWTNCSPKNSPLQPLSRVWWGNPPGQRGWKLTINLDCLDFPLYHPNWRISLILKFKSTFTRYISNLCLIGVEVFFVRKLYRKFILIVVVFLAHICENIFSLHIIYDNDIYQILNLEVHLQDTLATCA